MMILEGCTKKTNVVAPLEGHGDLDAPIVPSLGLQPLMNCVPKAMDL